MLFRVFVALFINFAVLSQAYSKTYIRDYTYTASEADSKISSRVIAMDQVKKILLQEIGTHIRQKINIRKNSSGETFASEDVEAITAGLTKVIIIQEKWNGITYFLRAKINADTDRVLNALDEFKNNQTEANNQQLEHYKANQRELDNAREEIERLKRQLTSAKTDIQKQKLVVEYTDTVESLTASEMVSKGYDFEKEGQLKKAFKLYSKAAGLGNALAKNNVGHMYLKGHYVSEDHQKAIKLFREASEKGSHLANSNLGYMYLKGYATGKNYYEALKFFRKAAAEDVALAQSNLGFMYLQGYGVEKDYNKASKLFQKAADKGNALAQSNLGFMFLNGYSVDKDYAEAVRLFRKAAGQGVALAKNNLGYMYLYGYSVEKSKSLSKQWFQKACDAGNQLGCKNLKIDAFK
jgi:TPR repeat protein